MSSQSMYPETTSFHAVTHVMTKMYSRYEHPVQYDDAAATAAVGYCKHEPIFVLAGCHSTNTHTHKLSKEETKQSIHASYRYQSIPKRLLFMQ